MGSNVTGVDRTIIGGAGQDEPSSPFRLQVGAGAIADLGLGGGIAIAGSGAGLTRTGYTLINTLSGVRGELYASDAGDGIPLALYLYTPGNFPMRLGVNNLDCWEIETGAEEGTLVSRLNIANRINGRGAGAYIQWSGGSAAAVAPVGTTRFRSAVVTRSARSWEYSENAGNYLPIGGIADVNTGQGACYALRLPFVAIGAGASDTPVFFSATAPFPFRVVDSKILVSTAVAASTATLRNALGGGGTALSDAWDTGTTGTKRDTALTATGTVPLGGTMVLRRDNSNTVGEVVVFIEPV